MGLKEGLRNSSDHGRARHVAAARKASEFSREDLIQYNRHKDGVRAAFQTNIGLEDSIPPDEILRRLAARHEISLMQAFSVARSDCAARAIPYLRAAGFGCAAVMACEHSGVPVTAADVDWLLPILHEHISISSIAFGFLLNLAFRVPGVVCQIVFTTGPLGSFWYDTMHILQHCAAASGMLSDRDRAALLATNHPDILFALGGRDGLL